MSKLTELSFAIEGINLDFAGPLDAFWGPKKYPSVHRSFYQNPSAEVVNNTSSNSVIHLHGFLRKIRVDNGSYFLSHDFETF